MKVYKALADAFVDEGVDTVFGLMGDGNMFWMAAMAKCAGVGVVHARHESAAAAMADGYARASGRVGVCSVTCGPGLTQIATSLTASARHRTPLVVFAGDTPHSAAFHLQQFEQRPFVESTGAAFVGSRSLDTVLDDAQLAFYLARRNRCPVVLSVPYDFQEQEYPWDPAYRTSDELIGDRQMVFPDPAAVVRATDLIARARRPVVLAGRGAVAARARDAIQALADRIGAVLLTSLRAKGWFDGHPYDLGVAGAFSSDSARALLSEADCVVAFGARLGYFTTEGGYLFPEAHIVHVDVDPMGRVDGQRVADLGLCADARLGAEQLLAALEERNHRSDGYRGDFAAGTGGDADQPEPDAAVGDGEVDPNAVIRELDAAVPKDWLVVVGAGHFWNFAVVGLDGRQPDSYIFTYDFGVIGQGLPTAMGAAVADGSRPVVLIEGDGSVLMNLQELESLQRHGIPVLVIVMNDGAYGAEVHKMRAKGADASEAVFGRTDLARVADALGLRAVTVDGPGQLASVVQNFATAREPTLADVRIAPEVISRQYRRLYFGQAAPP